MARKRVDLHWQPARVIDAEQGLYDYDLPESMEPGRRYIVEFRIAGPSGNAQYRILSEKLPSDERNSDA